MNHWPRWWTMPVLLFAGILIPGLLAPAPADADPADDYAFIRTLAGQGFTFTSEAEVIEAGHAVCDYLDLGFTLTEATNLVFQNTALTAADSGFFVGVSVAAYCPEHLPNTTPGVAA